jgi:succinate dehydrogenase/fumarate reductase flavoprotein subunit
MDLSLLMPTVRIPGEEIDGKPMYRIWQFYIGQPGNILVNKEGKRCCDEAFYPDIGRAFEEMDAQKLQPANLPMFWIVDQSYRDHIPVGPLPKGTEMADWLHKGDTIEELAEKLGLPPTNLKETVERFNKYAREGLDPDFHRGETGYDKRWGFWPNRKPNPVLSPLEKPPFYGLQLHVGTVGNMGGLVTNTKAQVIDVEGNPIPGLYATSNTAAPLAFGLAYTSGMVGGKAMIFGWLAAQHAAGITPEATKEVVKAPVPERQVAARETAGIAVAASEQTAAESTLASVGGSAPVEAIRGKGMQILNEDGSSVLDVERIEKAGDRLRMKGRLMGSFSTNMYLDATGFYRMLRMIIRPSTIVFALLSPVYWLRNFYRNRSR